MLICLANLCQKNNTFYRWIVLWHENKVLSLVYVSCPSPQRPIFCTTAYTPYKNAYIEAFYYTRYPFESNICWNCSFIFVASFLLIKDSFFAQFFWLALIFVAFTILFRSYFKLSFFIKQQSVVPHTNSCVNVGIRRPPRPCYMAKAKVSYKKGSARIST